LLKNSCNKKYYYLYNTYIYIYIYIYIYTYMYKTNKRQNAKFKVTVLLKKYLITYIIILFKKVIAIEKNLIVSAIFLSKKWFSFRLRYRYIEYKITYFPYLYICTAYHENIIFNIKNYFKIFINSLFIILTSYSFIINCLP